jgi:uncharacterized protein (DUF342 family)
MPDAITKMVNSMEKAKVEIPGDVIITEIEKIRFIIQDATGLDIMYAYENIVFAEHGIYLIEVDMDDKNKLNCYFNVDFESDKRLLFLEKLMLTASLNGMVIVNRGTFEMKQNPEGETFSLSFFDV